MNRKLAISLMIGAFTVGVIGGGWTVGYFFNRFALRSVYVSEAAKAGMDVSTLNLLQINDTTNAIRLLNSELDGSLMTLCFFQQDAAAADRKIAGKILKQAKEYRIKFPYKSSSPEIEQTVSNALSFADASAEK